MIEYFKTPLRLDKRFGFQSLLLAICLTASLLTLHVAAASVYQCATSDGRVIFTDSPAQLHSCQKLTFNLLEEELRSKKHTTQTSFPPERESIHSQDVAMMDDEFFESSSQDFEDDEFFEPRSNDFEDKELSDEEI
jgi:hypothetical protein